MKKVLIPTDQVNENTIAGWKQKHGAVYKFTVNDSVIYLRKPGRLDLSHATESGKEDPLKFNESIIRNCMLNDAMEFVTDDELFLSLGEPLIDVVRATPGELVKL